MVKKRERTGLGRGLSALMADIDIPSSGAAAADPGDYSARGLRRVAIDRITPNP